jgi:hypothetical protein
MQAQPPIGHVGVWSTQYSPVVTPSSISPQVVWCTTRMRGSTGRRRSPRRFADRRSIGKVGDALDKALMESAVELYKSELIDSTRRSPVGPRVCGSSRTAHGGQRRSLTCSPRSRCSRAEMTNTGAHPEDQRVKSGTRVAARGGAGVALGNRACCLKSTPACQGSRVFGKPGIRLACGRRGG